MTRLHVDDVCFQRRVGDNVGGKLIRSSSNERQYVCRAFCAFGFQSGRFPAVVISHRCCEQPESTTNLLV